jgi:hypothetical protein
MSAAEATTDEARWLRADWMQTYTGKRFTPLDPRPEDVDAVDIAHALSLLCRYNGHVDRFYSVAEHCVHLARWIHWKTGDRNLTRWALLHDAAEAYIGDMIWPLKAHMPDFQDVDAFVTGAIAKRFGLEGAVVIVIPSSRGFGKRVKVIPDEVKEADTRILLDEKAALLKPSPGAWTVDGLEPLGIADYIMGWSPGRAEAEYLAALDDFGLVP